PEPRAILTFTLPARSVAVHPGPTNGVVVSWHSAISGVVQVMGSVADADPAGGDGIAWEIDLRTGSTAKRLANGGFDNGGREGFEAGQGADRLGAIAVSPGDAIDLVVLPKTSHTCDTTTVSLKIAQQGGRTWDLMRDVMDDLLKGNPHSDSFGNPGVWEFADMGEARRGPVGGGPGLARLASVL